MLHPSYKELMEKVNETAPGEENITYSRYSLVLTAAKRARQLIEVRGAQGDHDKHLLESLPTSSLLQRESERRNLSIAVDDMFAGNVHLVNDPMKPKEQ